MKRFEKKKTLSLPIYLGRTRYPIPTDRGGVPFILRDKSTFHKISEAFGRTILPSEFDWEDDDNSFACCYVLTNIGKRIEEEVVSYPVWINEEMNSWSPLFADPNHATDDGSVSTPGNDNNVASFKQNQSLEQEQSLEHDPKANDDLSRKFSDNRRNSNGFSGDVLGLLTKTTGHKYVSSETIMEKGGDSKEDRDINP
ncbi:hypothetical protein L1987_23646 [Smallanthus sonchifolius]|uniref:Uncharacterized protein n=1 Tax=Smallanthus sonchifolius TaxID=185202 RepID=A0ACB9II17_9ASTR|nr:hypothetical protein L1987_23646 [Smallanthus sonchifolius]